MGSHPSFTKPIQTKPKHTDATECGLFVVILPQMVLIGEQEFPAAAAVLSDAQAVSKSVLDDKAKAGSLPS